MKDESLKNATLSSGSGEKRQFWSLENNGLAPLSSGFDPSTLLKLKHQHGAGVASLPVRLIPPLSLPNWFCTSFSSHIAVTASELHSGGVAMLCFASLRCLFPSATAPISRAPRATLDHRDEIGDGTGGQFVSEKAGLRWEKPQVLRVIALWLAALRKLRPLFASSDVFFFDTPSPLNLTALFPLETAALPAETDAGKCFMEYISALRLINVYLLAMDLTPEPSCCEPLSFSTRSQRHTHPCKRESAGRSKKKDYLINSI